MRVIVCGGRDFNNKRAVQERLDAIYSLTPLDALTIIQGGATGADKLAREWCQETFVPFDNYPADWAKFGNRAGPIRNQRMLDDGKPDLVVAFKGGKGTADMVRRAKLSGIEVEEVKS